MVTVGGVLACCLKTVHKRAAKAQTKLASEFSSTVAVGKIQTSDRSSRIDPAPAHFLGWPDTDTLWGGPDHAGQE